MKREKKEKDVKRGKGGGRKELVMRMESSERNGSEDSKGTKETSKRIK